MTAALSGYLLVPATPAQDLIATKREHLEWGAPLLTEDQFITREKSVLDGTDFSRNRRQRWVLVPADNTTTKDFVSACKTYRRPILFKRPGKERVESGWGYSVCSVFVPEGKRRMGYAGQMMTLLRDILKPKRAARPGDLVEGLDERKGELGEDRRYGSNATLSFLYSDVGQYYKKFGWQVVGNRHVEWPPLSQGDSPMRLPEGAKWLEPEELREVGRMDREFLLSQLQTPSSPGDGKIRFCLDDPEATSWRWLIKRSSFYATTHLPESAPKPKHFGLYLPSTSGKGDESYAVCIFDHIERKISILRFRFSSPQAFEVLIGAIRGQARQFGMKKCLAWNLDLASLGVEPSEDDDQQLKAGKKVQGYQDKLKGGVVVERQGSGASLPVLAWYADKQEGEDVEWVCNEYGWWC